MPAPEIMRLFADIESGGNPKARTGSYKGLYQLSDDEFNKHGGGDIYNPTDNTAAAGRKLDGEAATFKSTYGRDPTPTELYLQHQQGVGGYAAHAKNPDALAWENMASTGEGRTKGPEWARKAIWGNVPDDVKAQYPGGVDSLTSKQFIDLWQNKIDRRMGGQNSGGNPSMPPSYTNTNQRTAPPTNLDVFDPTSGMNAMAQGQMPQGDGNGLERGLQGAAASLMAVYNPAGANAMTAANKQSWHTVQGKDGRLYKINSATGEMQAVDGPGLPDEWAPKYQDGSGAYLGSHNKRTNEFRPATPENGGAGVNPDMHYPVTPGERAVDQKFSVDMADAIRGGGVKVDTHVGQLQNGIDLLKKHKDDRFGATGAVMGIVPPGLKPFFPAGQDAIKAQESIENAVVGGMRQVLGPQFTQQENKDFRARTFNPSLGEAENIRRAEVVMGQLKTMAAAQNDAVQHFRKHGSLSKYKGQLPSITDLPTFDDASPPAAGAAPAAGGTRPPLSSFQN